MAGTPHLRRLRRTWPQRLVLTFNVLLVIGCLLAAGLIWYGNDRLGQLERVTIDHGTAAAVLPGAAAPLPTSQDLDDLDTPGGDRAKNFLLVGSDSRECIDPAAPDAAGFLGEAVDGQRSDTIMVLRVDPTAEEAAILSFPRDLWVKIAGTERRSRINSAFDRENPSRLVQTIEANFGVPVDHYVEVDFCAFRSIVDAVGGVKVPFLYPTRDRYTGLNITAPGCVQLDGATALAYARSRHYQYYDGKRWRDDPTSDYGRIARQQDFIRRTLQRAIDRGARRPNVARDLIDAALDNVRVDQNLTVSEMLSLANRLRNFDPDAVRTYRVEAEGTTIGGAAVLLPDTESATAQRLFGAFRGEIPLSSITAPTTTGTTAAPPAATASVTTQVTGADTTTTVAPTPAPTAPDPANGIYPPDDPTCR